MQRLRDENTALEHQITALREAAARTESERREVAAGRVRADEATAMNVRSLKARKNELQIRVNTLEREKEQLSRQLSIAASSLQQQHQQLQSTATNNHYNNINNTETTSPTETAELQNQLVSALARIGELEADDGDFRKKLEESENLIHDLQQALSQANDLAMQKSVEATKMRRQIEAKADRLVQENTDLKRKVYFAGKSDGEISPTSLFPIKTPSASTSSTYQNHTNRLHPNNNTNGGDTIKSGFKLRKISMPASVYNYANRATDKSQQQQGSSSRGALKDSAASGRSSFDDVTDNAAHRPRVRRLNSANTAMSMNGNNGGNLSASSSQVELDLSQQLRELLDLTNDLTKTDSPTTPTITAPTANVDDDDDDTFAPPVPPPPANYETMDR